MKSWAHCDRWSFLQALVFSDYVNNEESKEDVEYKLDGWKGSLGITIPLQAKDFKKGHVTIIMICA